MIEKPDDFMNYFSATVPEAEDKFLRACRAANVKGDMVPYPASGPGGESLHVGVCRIGPVEAENLLVILSGTHGVEGFAGSALQVGLLHNLDELLLNDQTAILMVHLINPWGAAWNRRENEKNIDLFRNFHYCAAPTEPDALYDEIDDAIDWSNWGDTSAVEAVIAKYGTERITTAIRRGQHHRPKSMTFHGNGPSVNKIILDRVLRENAEYARRVAVLDVHTGFGSYGDGMIVSYDAPNSPKYESLSSWFGEGLYTPGEDADTPTHAINPYGFIEETCPNSHVVCGVLEYGTYPPDMTREVFPASSYFHNYGDPMSKEAQENGVRYRAFCYPEKADWKKAVWDRGFEVIGTMLQGFENWPGRPEI